LFLVHGYWVGTLLLLLLLSIDVGKVVRVVGSAAFERLMLGSVGDAERSRSGDSLLFLFDRLAYIHVFTNTYKWRLPV
jgi:hypothetical protein